MGDTLDCCNKREREEPAAEKAPPRPPPSCAYLPGPASGAARGEASGGSGAGHGADCSSTGASDGRGGRSDAPSLPQSVPAFPAKSSTCAHGLAGSNGVPSSSAQAPEPCPTALGPDMDPLSLTSWYLAPESPRGRSASGAASDFQAESGVAGSAAAICSAPASGRATHCEGAPLGNADPLGNSLSDWYMNGETYPDGRTPSTRDYDVSTT
eukprot:TRINITY_DN16242_c0_g1_i3.p1 TRINITY_DN16242_c0_g1~~TRINITY_DN16242_c0_g1_i3.p1  ORF type:complete len:211 (-),score=19.49 TRINITY_DN16242_c0_g1_i3:41-673(-)